MGCLLSPRLFNTVLEILASAIREEEEIKVSKLEKKTWNSLFEDMLLYIENPNFHQKTTKTDKWIQ